MIAFFETIKQYTHEIMVLSLAITSLTQALGNLLVVLGSLRRTSNPRA